MANCLECSIPLTPSRRGAPKRFCSPSCKLKMRDRAMRRGAPVYHLFRVMRRERDEAKRLSVWTEMCRLELAWNDQDEGRKTWLPAELVLSDIHERDMIPSTNIYVREAAE